MSVCLKECGHLPSGFTTEEYVFSFPSNNYLNVTSLSMMSFFCILLHFAFFEQFDQHCVLCFQQRSELSLRCVLPCVLTSFLHLWSHFLLLARSSTSLSVGHLCYLYHSLWGPRTFLFLYD